MHRDRCMLLQISPVIQHVWNFPRRTAVLRQRYSLSILCTSIVSREGAQSTRFTHQSSKPSTTHVNLHFDTFLVCQRTRGFSLCRCICLTMDRNHTAHAVIHFGKLWVIFTCITVAAEAQYEAESVTKLNSPLCKQFCN